jgi:FlaA1/EpsC-like NDP-sugar epimerase
MEQTIAPGTAPESCSPPYKQAEKQAVWQRLAGSAIRWPCAYAAAVLADVVTVIIAFEIATGLRFLGIPIAFSVIFYELGLLFPPCVIIGIGYASIACVFGLHRRLWQYASLKDGFALMQAIGVTTLLAGIVDLGWPGLRALLPLGVVIIGGSLSFLLLGCVKLFPRMAQANHPASTGARTRVLIVGAGQAGADLAARFLLNSMYGYQVEAFIDDDPTKWRRRLHGKRVVGPTTSIPDVVQQLTIDLIAIALPSASTQRISEIIAICQKTSARIKIMEGLDEVAGRQQPALNLREINVADLLGRGVISLQTAEARNTFEGKTLLVTGAAGSIGSELCRQLIKYNPAALIALDTNETGLYDLAQTLHTPSYTGRLLLRICDITDEESTRRLFATERPQAVFHAAAYKHVPLLEENPDQAVHNNVLGTYRLCCIARDYAPERFIFISSDKAADPVSMLGASKRCGELIVQAMADSGGATRFCTVRFGNVIGSRGSVVPTFAAQIEHGGPVTVTHPEATRYFMTISEAAGLVIHTGAICDNGGLFLLDMGDPVPVRDLAVKMIRARGLRVGHDVRIVYTGLRPGERLHETLASADEQLVQTTYKKIFRVAQTRKAPDLAAIAQWTATLQNTLTSGEGATLRACLFDIIKTAWYTEPCTP